MNGYKKDKMFLVREIVVFSFVISLLGCSGGGTDSTVATDTNNSLTSEPMLGQAIGGADVPAGLNVTEGNVSSPIVAIATENTRPEITTISLGCDLSLDTISMVVGETTEFQVNVDDEANSTLSYTIVSDDLNLLDVAVNKEGRVSLRAVAAGDVTAPIVVTDDQGMQDQILLNVTIGS